MITQNFQKIPFLWLSPECIKYYFVVIHSSTKFLLSACHVCDLVLGVIGFLKDERVIQREIKQMISLIE